MVQQAKSVGQLLAALTRAAAESGSAVVISHANGQYAVRVDDDERTICGAQGPKLFRLLAEVGAKFLATQATPPAFVKLLNRIGALANRGAVPESPDFGDIEDEEDEASER